MQKYKEGEWLYRIVGMRWHISTLGKYLLEREKLAKENAWVLDE